MSVEELLKTRYKVIADWPGRATSFGSPMAVGAIIELSEITENGNPYDFIRQSGNKYSWKSENGMKVVGEKFFDSYPHLFRKLSWWEERGESEMPEYVKVDGIPRRFMSVQLEIGIIRLYDLPGEVEYEERIFKDRDGKGYELYNLEGTTPVTESEYLTYTQNQINDNGK